MSNQLCARLKPYNPRTGHVIQRITFHALGGKRFEQGFWYLVSDEEAAVLRAQHQVDGDLRSPKAFDVCTIDESERIVHDETQAALLNTPHAKSIFMAPGRDGADAPTPVDIKAQPSPADEKKSGPTKRKA